MPVAYPLSLRTIVQASKSRSQPASFRVSEPRRGFGYVQAIGTDTPVFWDVQFRFRTADAVRFQLWFRSVTERGLQEFTLPIRTEFGLVDHVCRFLPEGLLDATESGGTITYTARVMARAQVVPQAYLDAEDVIIALPDWDGWSEWLDIALPEMPDPVAPVYSGPTLVLDFLAQEYRIGPFLPSRALSEIVTFTRTTAGSRYNAAGVLVSEAANVPRIDHDPVTLAPRGLVVEEQRVNLVTQSEFASGWTPAANTTLTPNALLAPDGATTMARIEATAAVSGLVRITRSVSGFTSGVTYTISVHFKRGQQRYGYVAGNAPAFGVTPIAYFDLQSNVVSSQTNVLAAGMERGPNDTWRCWIVATATATTADLILYGCSSANGAQTHTPAAADGIFAWGAQVEAGDTPTTYVATGASQITRAIDEALVSGAAFSSFLASGQGTFVAEVWRGASSAANFQAILSLNDATANNRLTVGINAGGTSFRFLRNTAGAGLIQTPVTANAALIGRNRVAWRFGPNDLAISANGGAVASVTSHTLATVTRMEIARQLGAAYLNGDFSTLTYHPGLRSDAELVALSTL